MSHLESAYKKVTTNTIQKMKIAGEKISMITAYDYSFAKIFDELLLRNASPSGAW